MAEFWVVTEPSTSGSCVWYVRRDGEEGGGRKEGGRRRETSNLHLLKQLAE
jgi:hypothetical protein